MIGVKTFTAVLHREEDMYVAECPEVGTVSQGKTIDEAVNNLKDATELYLEEFPLKEERRTLMTTFEMAFGAGVGIRTQEELLTRSSYTQQPSKTINLRYLQ